MSFASSAVTYTSVYTDSEPGRVFWGADDEKVSEGGVLRVIVYGYNRFPIQLVAPPSPDFIPDPKDPQTLPSAPEEDPKEYEDDELEDGPADYPMDGGDDGDGDDGDSSRDDADDEDEEDEEDEEEEEHIAPIDFAIVAPTEKLVSPPEETEPVIPPSSTDTSTVRARITVRLQTSISLPPEAEVERLLSMTTPSPSHYLTKKFPPPPQHGEIASTRALINVVTATLPSPSLPPLPPSLYIPPPVDRKDKIPEFEQPPRKRLCLSTLGSIYEVDPVGAVSEIALVTLGEVSARVVELAEVHEHDTQDLYALLEATQDSLNTAQLLAFRILSSRTQHQGNLNSLSDAALLRSQRLEMFTVELLAHQGQQRRARQPGPEARISDHQDASEDTDSHI
ncbi:hypothetical protein Tco_1409433 [Tanacetum coccineum]